MSINLSTRPPSSRSGPCNDCSHAPHGTSTHNRFPGFIFTSMAAADRPLVASNLTSLFQETASGLVNQQLMQPWCSDPSPGSATDLSATHPYLALKREPGAMLPPVAQRAFMVTGHSFSASPVPKINEFHHNEHGIASSALTLPLLYPQLSNVVVDPPNATGDVAPNYFPICTWIYMILQ